VVRDKKHSVCINGINPKQNHLPRLPERLNLLGRQIYLPSGMLLDIIQQENGDNVVNVIAINKEYDSVEEFVRGEYEAMYEILSTLKKHGIIGGGSSVKKLVHPKHSKKHTQQVNQASLPTHPVRGLDGRIKWIRATAPQKPKKPTTKAATNWNNATVPHTNQHTQHPQHLNSNPTGTVAGMMADSATNNALHNAATRTGVDLSTLQIMAMIESTGNRYIGTNRYGYTGLMQMGHQALADVNRANHSHLTMDNLRNDVNANALAAAEYMRLNEQELQRRNITITPLNVYLSHQLGEEGFRQLLHTLQTNPGAPLTHDQKNNYYGRKKTPTQQDFYNYWVNRVNQFQQQTTEYNNR
jgi:hypothetical protein